MRELQPERAANRAAHGFATRRKSRTNGRVHARHRNHRKQGNTLHLLLLHSLSRCDPTARVKVSDSEGNHQRTSERHIATSRAAKELAHDEVGRQLEVMTRDRNENRVTMALRMRQSQPEMRAGCGTAASSRRIPVGSAVTNGWTPVGCRCWPEVNLGQLLLLVDRLWQGRRSELRERGGLGPILRQKNLPDRLSHVIDISGAITIHADAVNVRQRGRLNNPDSHFGMTGRARVYSSIMRSPVRVDRTRNRPPTRPN